MDDFMPPALHSREWKTLSCPDPLYCLTLENANGRKCRDLATTEDFLTISREIVKGSEKEKFHAAANKLMTADWLVGLLNLSASANFLAAPVLRGALMNPNLTVDTLPPASELARTPRLAERLLAYPDLVPDDYLLEISLRADEMVWQSLVRNRVLPVEVCKQLLLQTGYTFLKRTLVSKPSTPPEVLVTALSTPSPESLIDPSVTFTEEARISQVVARNPALPIEAIFTCRIPDGASEELALKNAEARADEATVWLQENYPELVGVPFEWVRQTLCN